MSRSYKKLLAQEIKRINSLKNMLIANIENFLWKILFNIKVIKKLFVLMIFVTTKMLVQHLSNIIKDKLNGGEYLVAILMNLFPQEKRLGKSI